MARWHCHPAMQRMGKNKYYIKSAYANHYRQIGGVVSPLTGIVACLRTQLDGKQLRFNDRPMSRWHCHPSMQRTFVARSNGAEFATRSQNDFLKMNLRSKEFSILKNKKMKILSLQNEKIKYLRKQKNNKFLLFLDTPKLIEEAVLSGLNPKEILIDEKKLDTFKKRFPFVCKLHEENILLTTEEIISSLADVQTPQGILGVFEIKQKGF